MHEAVSDILIERSREAEGISRMVVLSFLGHAILLAVLVVLPPTWRSSSTPDVTPMMITIASGGPGPDAGGLTPISAKPIQEASTETKPAPVAPPAPKVPEMVMPEPKARPAPKASAKPVERPVDKSTTRKPTTGPEVKAGDARNDTGGAAIPFGGLTRPSGGGSASTMAMTDYADFCCPAYLTQMVDLIRRNWNQNQGAAGQAQIKFTIQRDGIVRDVQVAKSSNISLLDLEAQRAVLKTQALPPLPREFTPNTLTVTVIFDYHR